MSLTNVVVQNAKLLKEQRDKLSRFSGTSKNDSQQIKIQEKLKTLKAEYDALDRLANGDNINSAELLR